MNFKSSLFIGLIQCLALIPGVSRSGSVLTAMRLNGYNRDQGSCNIQITYTLKGSLPDPINQIPQNYQKSFRIAIDF